MRLTGEATARGHTLTAPIGGTQTLAYRYRETREIDDEDEGRETVEDTRRAVDIVVETPDGDVEVQLGDAVEDIFYFHYVHTERDRDRDRDRRGRRVDYRYTEDRLDPGDEVFVFGYAEETPDGYTVRFDQPGHYTPVVSGGEESRHWLRLSGMMLLGAVATVGGRSLRCSFCSR